MKPIKSLSGIGRWLMRLALSITLLYVHINAVFDFRYETIGFYFSLLLVVFSFLLIVGGFVRKHHLTVLSALIIFVVLLFQVVIAGGIGLSNTGFLTFYQLAIAVFFMAYGNNK